MSLGIVQTEADVGRCPLLDHTHCQKGFLEEVPRAGATRTIPIVSITTLS